MKNIHKTAFLSVVLLCIAAAFLVQFHLKKNYKERYISNGEVYHEQEKTSYDPNSGLEYAIGEDESGETYIMTCGYQGNDKIVVIPEYIQDISVKYIGEMSFLYQDEIERIELPDSITKICNFSFGSCSQLKEISIPSSVQEIEDYAILTNDNETKSMKDITIITEKGSEAAEYAKKKKLKIKYVGNDMACEQ
ncbi:MAG: leucine-rich repeat protein [Lachnospiraceae bacterium]|nr:leucine-rich repeat protein [Lachnospiraceae bacterium]